MDLVYGLQGQYEKATESTKQALRLAPERAFSYINLANYSIALQHFDETRQVIHQRRRGNWMIKYSTMLFMLLPFSGRTPPR